AVAQRQQARDAVKGWPKIIAAAFVGGAGVDRHADAQTVDGRKVRGSQRTLRVESGARRRFGRRERGAKRVADRFEDAPAACGDRVVHQTVVYAQRRLHRSAIARPANRASLDVAEQKAYRTAGERNGRDAVGLRHGYWSGKPGRFPFSGSTACA